MNRWNDAAPIYTLLGTDLPVQTILLRALLLFMVLDILLGYGCAIIGLKVNSAATFRGMMKKGGVLMLILVATVLEGIVGLLFRVEYPLIFNEAITAFFVAWELTSITENLATLGVPIPETWVAALSKLREVDHLASEKLVHLDPRHPITVRTDGEPLKVTADRPIPVETPGASTLAVTQTDHNETEAPASEVKP